jgi:N-methylhydantoinase B
VTVRCNLTIKDGEAAFDFSDSDEQCKGYINEVYLVTLSFTLATVFLFLDPALAAFHNEGSLRPFHVIAREGTVVNCNPGSLTGAAPSLTGNAVNECVLSVLSQALPHRAIAAYARALEVMIIGQDSRTNQLYVYISFCPDGGAGTVSGYDGYQCCCLGGTLGVVSKADAEEEMVRFPWRVKRYEFMTDSAGAGKWRGAPGIWWEAVNEGTDCVDIGGPCDGWNTQGQGAQGGQSTPFNEAYILRGTEQIEIHHPHGIQHLKTGDIFVGKSGGGAGVGPPRERDPEAVRKDVKSELVSIKAARNVYNVVLIPDSLEIDYEAIKKLREKS